MNILQRLKKAVMLVTLLPIAAFASLTLTSSSLLAKGAEHHESHGSHGGEHHEGEHHDAARHDAEHHDNFRHDVNRNEGVIEGGVIHNAPVIQQAPTVVVPPVAPVVVPPK